jgi:hypothetical protein
MVRFMTIVNSRPCLLVSLLAATICTGCGGGSTGGADGGLRDSDAAFLGADSGTTAACVSKLNVYTRTGNATVSSGAVNETMPERICETLRGPDGTVVGWGAYFGPALPNKQPSVQPYIKVVIAGGYKGDGTYGNTAKNTPSGLSVAYLTSTGAGLLIGSASAQSTLVLSNAGKKFVFDASAYGDLAAVHIEGSCDPADDTAAVAGPAVGSPAAGYAHVVDSLGAVHVYDCLTCDAVANKLSMRAPTGDAPRLFGKGLPTYFTFNVSKTADKYLIDNGEFNWQSPGVSVSGGGSSVQITATSPYTGTFIWNSTSTSGRNATGAFTCPSK